MNLDIKYCVILAVATLAKLHSRTTENRKTVFSSWLICTKGICQFFKI